MPLPVYHLRRLLMATAVVLTLAIMGMYFYARSRATNVLKTIPGKMGYDIKQTAHGFQFSKSDGKRTLFTVQASDVREFKLNGNAELHNVSIVLYGHDASRFDQIYGDEFAFNQQTGDVTAKGEVQIDLVGNPAGLASPDQSAPKEFKNPIHVKTRDLVFNKNTGNASTNARVEFQTPQASGWAVGVEYTGKSNRLTFTSQIHIDVSGPSAATIVADSGVVTSEPRQILLNHPRVSSPQGALQTDQAALFLSAENAVQRVLATGNVHAKARLSSAKPIGRSHHGASVTQQEVYSRADQADFLFADNEEVLNGATLTGNVHLEQTGPQPLQGDAGRVILDFGADNQVQKIHALDGVRLSQTNPANLPDKNKEKDNAPANFVLTAPAIDFSVEQGHILRYAETSSRPQIIIAQEASQNHAAQQTVVTAGKFDAEFASSDGQNHPVSMHGAPQARIVSSSAEHPDRVSTSESVDAAFLPQGGIESITQTGNVIYSDGEPQAKGMQAWAGQAHYTPIDQIIVLTGNPRIVSSGIQTTANTVRINRASNDVLAEGNVKSTYSDLKEQPDGALLASSSPIHVTSNSMTAHSNPGVALYSGKARLWQDANVIQAPSIEFDRDHRSVTAQGTPTQPVQTILIQSGLANAQTKAAQSQRNTQEWGSSPISITAMKLTYADSDRRVHYEGGVIAKGPEFTASAKTLDAFLLSRTPGPGAQSIARPGQLDRMEADGDVIVQQPKRRAEGQKLVYSAAEDKFVLTGGPPSIFDAEQGKITGVSLTFFRRDDRVLVEGEATAPVVTQTRVAR